MNERDNRGLWATGKCICPICGKFWVAVWPASCKELECPECCIMLPAPSIEGVPVTRTIQ